MPWGDGTGPWGQGPMTGRGLGYCAGYPHPGFVVPGPGFGRGFGRGWGRGFGRGRGFRWRRFWRYPLYPVGYPVRPFYSAYRYSLNPAYPIEPTTVEPIRLTREEQKKILEEEKKELELDIKAIQEEIKGIERRLKELK